MLESLCLMIKAHCKMACTGINIKNRDYNNYADLVWADDLKTNNIIIPLLVTNICIYITL